MEFQCAPFLQHPQVRDRPQDLQMQGLRIFGRKLGYALHFLPRAISACLSPSRSMQHKTCPSGPGGLGRGWNFPVCFNDT